MKLKSILFLIMMVVLARCGIAPAPADDHAHDEINLQFTSYEHGLELFAEATPFVQGRRSTILVHLTQLEGFDPLIDGTVTTSLIVGQKGVRQSSNQPVSPGIYQFELMPAESGSGRLVFDVEGSAGKIEFLFRDITIFADEEEAYHAAEEKLVTDPNGVLFTKEQSWKTDFSTGLPQLNPFGQVIRTSGRVLYSNAEATSLSAGLSGMIAGVGNNLNQGSVVKAGESLFTVKGNSFAIDNSGVRYAEAQSNYESALSDYNRIKSLYDEKLATQGRYLEAKNRMETTRAQFETLKKNFGPEGQIIRSEKDGIIASVLVSNGQFVEAGQTLLTISSNEKYILSIPVQQKYGSLLKSIKGVTAVNTATKEALDLNLSGWRYLSHSASMNPSNGMIELKLEINNNSSLIPGMIPEILLRTESDRPVLTVPATALLEEQGLFFVFIQLTPELFVKREVRTGESDGFTTVILSGLTSNERIVTRGPLYVKLSQAAGALDPHAGHVH